MYAIFETGGKQYKVQKDDVVFIEKLDVEEGSSVTFDKVFMVNDESGLKVGTPLVAGATVSAKIVKNGKGPKIRILKYKAKKGYRKRMGHRQPYTKIQIENIAL